MYIFHYSLQVRLIGLNSKGAKLFIVGIIPGIILTLLFSGYIIFRVKKNPSLAPPVPGIPWRQRSWLLSRTWGVVLLAVLILGSSA